METVKVDLQKLQLLNDRIAQTIEALNQVRLSTHGLQHAATFGQSAQTVSPFGVWGMQPGVYGPQAQMFSQIPYSILGQTYPYGQGIGHTSPFTTPFTTNPFTQNGVGVLGTTGIDPLLAQRVQQTFPFVGAPYVPIA